MLTKEQILQASDLKKEKVTVPEWGGDVFVRALTGTERDAFEASIIQGEDKRNMANLRARLCVLTLVDSQGERLFADADADALGKKSAAALDIVFAVAQKLNGIGAADIKELEKNSGAAASGGSTSD